MRPLSKMLAVSACVLVVAGCPTVEVATKSEHDDLEQRVADIEIYLKGVAAPTPRPDPTSIGFESLESWLGRVKESLCRAEILANVPTTPTNYRLCPNGPTDPNGNPPPAPPFF